MLVVTMYPDHRVFITVPASDQPTRIEVLNVSRERSARIGFQPPRQVEIMRDDALAKSRNE